MHNLKLKNNKNNNNKINNPKKESIIKCWLISCCTLLRIAEEKTSTVSIFQIYESYFLIFVLNSVIKSFRTF